MDRYSPIINHSKAPDKSSLFALKQIKAEHEVRDHRQDFRNKGRALEKYHSVAQKEKHLITVRPSCRVTLSLNTYSLVV